VPTQLHQVLLNLCVNARDAMPKGGTLTLTVKNAPVNAADALRQLVEPGRYVCISVKDSGQGIPPDALGKIFQPFFTTKGQDKGTGLGLSTCRSIVKNHGGFISVNSKPGEGAEFKVYLPASDGKSETTIIQKTTLPAGHGEQILVVDDEESILAITRAALQNFGYQVFIAGNGVEAVTIFSKNPDSIKLVISDLAMPLMGGRETIEELRKIRPGLKVIIASGTERELEEVLPQVKTDGVIHKPFTNEKLLETVHQVLTNKTIT
jgi:CheY-like chemotaxis protein